MHFTILLILRELTFDYLFLLSGELATDDISGVAGLQYDFSKIRAATGDFDDANMLGQGGFGAVYKVIEYFTVMYENMQNSQ